MAVVTGSDTAGLVVARRPVVDGARRLVAFELVYHPQVPAHDRYASADSVPVAVHELLRSHDTTLDDVVGDKHVLCDVTLDVLAGDAPLMLPPRRTVLQLRRSDLATTAEKVAEACAWRRAEGYRLLLDLPSGTTELPEELHGVVDVVGVDLGSLDLEHLRETVARLRESGAEVLVRGCDTVEGMRAAVRSGALWLQGRSVQAPPVREGATIAPSAVAQVRLGMELLSRDLDVKRIEAILRAEPALVAQVLDLASAGRHRGTRGQVRSVREALVVMGSIRVQRWAAVTILGRHGSPDTDALMTGLVRARTCELLAPEWGAQRDVAFTAGLLSALGLVLGVDEQALLARLDLDDDLVAFAFRRQGPLGEGITRVEAYQRAVEGGSEPTGDEADVVAAAAAAFGWASSLLGVLDSSGR